MKRLVNGKKRSKVSLLITLVLCVAFIFGPGGIPLTALAETETETQASVEETPAPEENVSVAAEGESSGKSVSDALPEQNGTGRRDKYGKGIGDFGEWGNGLRGNGFRGDCLRG